jgi:predicted DNA-binding transcriptional regulator AlpA
MSEQLLKARDVAQLLGLEMGTVLDRFEAGDLPGFRLYGRKGGPVRFRLSEINDWLDRYCRHGNIDAPAARQRPGADTEEGAFDARPTLRRA